MESRGQHDVSLADNITGCDIIMSGNIIHCSPTYWEPGNLTFTKFQEPSVYIRRLIRRSLSKALIPSDLGDLGAIGSN